MYLIMARLRARVYKTKKQEPAHGDENEEAIVIA
jgi:hypothetical protein